MTKPEWVGLVVTLPDSETARVWREETLPHIRMDVQTDHGDEATVSVSSVVEAEDLRLAAERVQHTTANAALAFRLNLAASQACVVAGVVATSRSLETVTEAQVVEAGAEEPKRCGDCRLWISVPTPLIKGFCALHRCETSDSGYCGSAEARHPAAVVEVTDEECQKATLIAGVLSADGAMHRENARLGIAVTYDEEKLANQYTEASECIGFLLAKLQLTGGDDAPDDS